jgi:hypothetical protein
MKTAMRNIILLLVLANVLLLAWKRWVVPPDVAWPERLASSGEPQLALAKPKKTAVLPESAGNSAPETEPSPPVAEARRCVRIGPFAEAGTADSIARQLDGRGFSTRRTSEQGDVWVGHWVQLVDLENEQVARDTVNRLVDAGLPDTYIVQTEPTYNISLGVFRGRKGADRVRELARGLGLNPETTDRFRQGTQHWINVQLADGQTFDLQDIQLDRRPIIRTEDVACAVDEAVEPLPDAG